MPPARLASEDVIISAPMSYAGSAQRIFRLRRRARTPRALGALTVAALLMVILAWGVVSAWYLIWSFWLIPYRLVRRGARKRRVAALRHRELLGTIQGSAAASAVAIVTASAGDALRAGTARVEQPHVRADSVERERAASALHAHYVAGRLSADELDERVASAYAARTRDELSVLLGDLPALGDPGAG